jgi:hypothetical protein
MNTYLMVTLLSLVPFAFGLFFKIRADNYISRQKIIESNFVRMRHKAIVSMIVAYAMLFTASLVYCYF